MHVIEIDPGHAPSAHVDAPIPIIVLPSVNETFNLMRVTSEIGDFKPIPRVSK
jgi:hypothetical protein